MLFFSYNNEKISENPGPSENILLVMEYADGGTLQDYLKKEFNKLTWNSKYDLAYQLACGVSFLHEEEIVHCGLVICIIYNYLLILTFIKNTF